MVTIITTTTTTTTIIIIKRALRCDIDLRIKQ
jgi:hypothetical protein